MTWLKIIIVSLFVIAVIIFGPILTIWSLNTLFPVLNIPYTLETWAAAFLIGGSISGLSMSRKNND